MSLQVYNPSTKKLEDFINTKKKNSFHLDKPVKIRVRIGPILTIL
jgi:hypothetical protein